MPKRRDRTFGIVKPVKLGIPKPTTALWIKVAEVGPLVPTIRANPKAAIKFFGAVAAMREDEAQLREIIYSQCIIEMSDQELLEEAKASDEYTIDHCRLVLSVVENSEPASSSLPRTSAFARLYEQDFSEYRQRLRNEPKQWSPKLVELAKRNLEIQFKALSDPGSVHEVQWMRSHARMVLKAARGG
jgi:hypothetical protein